MLRLRHAPLFAALALLVLTGCRTYGDGYDIKPKTYRALQSAVESFEDELSRAEADLQMLRGVADDADTLRALADRYEELIGEHNSLLETQRERVDRLSAKAGYRSLHTAYGATVTEQRMQKQKYRRTLTRIRATVQGPAVAQPPSPDKLRRYMIRPVNFPESDRTKALTMREALSGR